MYVSFKATQRDPAPKSSSLFESVFTSRAVGSLIWLGFVFVHDSFTLLHTVTNYMPLISLSFFLSLSLSITRCNHTIVLIHYGMNINLRFIIF